MILIPINSLDYMMETSIQEQLSEVSGATRPVSVLLVYPSTSDVALGQPWIPAGVQPVECHRRGDL